jgi:hypothetical protein
MAVTFDPAAAAAIDLDELESGSIEGVSPRWGGALAEAGVRIPLMPIAAVDVHAWYGESRSQRRYPHGSDLPGHLWMDEQKYL